MTSIHDPMTADEPLPVSGSSAAEIEEVKQSAPLKVEIVMPEDVTPSTPAEVELRKEEQASLVKPLWLQLVDRLLVIMLRLYKDIANDEQQLISVGGREVALLLAFGSVAGIILMGGNTLPALVLAGSVGLFLIICGIDMIVRKFQHPK